MGKNFYGCWYYYLGGNYITILNLSSSSCFYLRMWLLKYIDAPIFFSGLWLDCLVLSSVDCFISFYLFLVWKSFYHYFVMTSVITTEYHQNPTLTALWSNMLKGLSLSTPLLQNTLFSQRRITMLEGTSGKGGGGC